mgnify:CR=1 FL=1
MPNGDASKKRALRAKRGTTGSRGMPGIMGPLIRPKPRKATQPSKNELRDEALAAVMLLRGYVPDIRIRVVNVVDLMALEPQSEHPHGLCDDDFDAMFTRAKPVVFAFHGYPGLIHRLTYRRTNHENMQVRGYKEEGTTTTPFDMMVLNNLDRFQLALDAIRRIPRLTDRVEAATQRYWRDIERHGLYVGAQGQDLP